MRGNAIEHHVAFRAVPRKPRPAHSRATARPVTDLDHAVAPAAIDEAFASLARIKGRISRLDAPAEAEPIAKRAPAPSEGAAVSSSSDSLWKQVADQLKSLDRQRADLARLLRRIDAERND